MSQDQKIVKDERGHDQPADSKRALQATPAEGGAAYENAKGSPEPDDKGQGLTGEDKRQGSLRNGKGDPTEGMPEGLRRERTHP